MRILFFEEDILGHRLEYLHHYYVGGMSHPENAYIFYVPKEFDKEKGIFDWPATDNITFQYFTEKEIAAITTGSLIKRGFRKSLLLRKKVRETSANKVFLSTLTVFIPFICSLLPSTVKVSGILYDVHLLNSSISTMRVLMERLRYRLAIKSKCVDTMFVLNDEESSMALNAKYKTNKFRHIVDPAPDVKGMTLTSLRSSLNIPSKNTAYLHFGGMADRKGTLEILRAIKMAEHGEFANKTFIFAGRIYDDIHNEFYTLLSQCRQNAQIIVYDEFCPYPLLYNLCYTSDVILIPYKLSTFSSGVLGYASAFDKMVVGTSAGLIGHLINRYKIGTTLDDVSANGLYKFLLDNKADIHSTEYASVNSLQKFINTIFDVINR